ncbi:MAG: nucleoside/nucleotide kinase family protein [Pseudomonadota bacterium]
MTDLAGRILATPPKARRRLVAVAGPPASGKSTLAETLAQTLPHAALVPMDGFHLDNRVLDARGDRPRKGAPWTFDAAGFVALCARLGSEEEVFYPTFDRARDIAVAGSGQIGPDTETVIVEGNYLLYAEAPWRDLAPLWDLSIWLEVPLPTLEARLRQRWADLKLTLEETCAKVEENDLPNARLICENRLPADVEIGESSQL